MTLDIDSITLNYHIQTHIEHYKRLPYHIETDGTENWSDERWQ